MKIITPKQWKAVCKNYGIQKWPYMPTNPPKWAELQKVWPTEYSTFKGANENNFYFTDGTDVVEVAKV